MLTSKVDTSRAAGLTPLRKELLDDGGSVADVRRLPGAVHGRWQWQASGACRDRDTTDFFHPVAERGPARRRRDQAAISVCLRCPVVTECRRYALNAQEPYGVWGGLSEDDRANILRAGAGHHQGR